MKIILRSAFSFCLKVQKRITYESLLNKKDYLANILAMINLSAFSTPQEIKMQTAQKAKKRRKAKKMTQQQLAQASGVSLGSLKRFEQTGEISFSSLLNIAWALDSLDEFEGLFSKKTYNSIQEVLDEAKRIS